VAALVGRSKQDCLLQAGHATRCTLRRRKARAAPASSRRPTKLSSKNKVSAGATLAALPASDGPVRARMIGSLLQTHCFKEDPADLLLSFCPSSSSRRAACSSNSTSNEGLITTAAAPGRASDAEASKPTDRQETAAEDEAPVVDFAGDCEPSPLSPGALDFLDSMHTGLTPEVDGDGEVDDAPRKGNACVPPASLSTVARRRPSSFGGCAGGAVPSSSDEEEDVSRLDLIELDDYQPKGLHKFIFESRARRAKLSDHRAAATFDDGKRPMRSPGLRVAKRGRVELPLELRRVPKLLEELDSSTKAAILAFDDDSPRGGTENSDDEDFAPLPLSSVGCAA